MTRSATLTGQGAVDRPAPAPAGWARQVPRLVSIAIRVALAIGLLAAVAALGAGWQLMAVTTNSMHPTAPQGSLALVSPISPDEVGVGVPIVFSPMNRPEVRVLHRVTSITAVDGVRAFRTKGDANPTPDAGVVMDRQIVGRLRAAIPWLGSIVARLQPPFGPVLLIGGPMLLLIAPRVGSLRTPGTEEPPTDRQMERA